MIYKFFYKKSSDGGVKSENILNQQSAEELHKSIIRKSEYRKERIQKLKEAGDY